MKNILTLLFALLLLTGSAWAQAPAQTFPPDPKAQVMDRAYVDTWGNGKQVVFYAVLYNADGIGRMDVYKWTGGPWQKMKHIKVEFEGEWVRIPDRSVLAMGIEGNELYLSWDNYVGYQEGAVKITHVYNRSTGQWRNDWVD